MNNIVIVWADGSSSATQECGDRAAALVRIEGIIKADGRRPAVVTIGAVGRRVDVCMAEDAAAEFVSAFMDCRP